jgi:hypothetical protein
MILRLILMCALLPPPAVIFAQQGSTEATARQKFASGGTIHMHLESGGYSIAPTDAQEIVVACHARSDQQLKQVRFQIKVTGSCAEVYVLNTPNNSFNATTEVPRRSHLWARLTGGGTRRGSCRGR